MAWAQIIGAAVSAYGNYKSNKSNEQGAKDTLGEGIAAVEPKNVTGGYGSFTVGPDGTRKMELDERYAKERDYFLDDAEINKGYLSAYQEGGPAGAANTLFEERVDPLRRNQARAEALFDEQGNARGMLGASEMMFARGQNTAGYQQAESAVYNQSYTDVQDIIDRYRARISTGVNQAVDIEGIPQGYAEFGMNQGAVFKPGAESIKGLTEANQGSATYLGEAATSAGEWFGKQKFSTGSKSAGTHKPFVTPRGGMVSGPMSYLK